MRGSISLQLHPVNVGGCQTLPDVLGAVLDLIDGPGAAR
jgi:hypothetical protein